MAPKSFAHWWDDFRWNLGARFCTIGEWVQGDWPSEFNGSQRAMPDEVYAALHNWESASLRRDLEDVWEAI